MEDTEQVEAAQGNKLELLWMGCIEIWVGNVFIKYF